MKKSALKPPTPTFRTFLLLITLLTLVNPQIIPQANAEANHQQPETLLPDPITDPCSLIPAGGEVSTRSEATCVAQYAAQPGAQVVQVQIQTYGHSTATLCEGLRQPSDFHEIMNDASFGDCGIEVEIGYKGEPAPGYIGWAIIYYYQGIHVRIATNQDYPANQNWVYDSAVEIENAIEAHLGAETTGDDETVYPPWLENDRIYIDRNSNVYEVPEWLDWIKPEQSLQVRGSVRPWLSGGDIWVYNRAFDRWIGPIHSEIQLYSGDRVATGPNTTARVYFSDPAIQQAGVSVSVGSDTVLEVPSMPETETTEHPYLWMLYKGVVKIKKAVLGETPEHGYSPFIIRTATVVCGSRGTEFIVSFDPKSQDSSIHLLSGELDTYNLVAGGSESTILTAGNRLVVGEDGSKVIAPYDMADVDSLISQHNLAGGETIPDEQFDALGVESETVEETADSSPFPIGIVLLVIFLCLAGLMVLVGVVAVVAILARKKANRSKLH